MASGLTFIGSALIMLSLLGCTQMSKDLRSASRKISTDGSSSGPGSGSDSSGPTGGQEAQEQLFIDKSNIDPNCKELEFSPRSIRTLTRSEYIATVSSQLNIDLSSVAIADELPIDSIVKGYRNIAALNQITPSRIKLYFKAAEVVSRAFMAQKADVLNCGQAASVCADLWLKDKLPLLWRQKVSEEDMARLRLFFEQNGSNANAFQLIVERILLSPNFLTLKELGTSGQLSSYEMASSLAFALWGQGPDQELLAAAEANQFATPEGLQARIRSMMKDARFDYGLKRFIESWLEVDRIHLTNNNATSYPGFSDEIKASIKDEVFLVLRYLIDNGLDTYQNLFNVDFTFTTPKVASFYNYQPHPDQVKFRNYTMYQLPASVKGVLGLPGVIAGLSSNNNTNIPARGTFVLSKLLCTELPTPSASVLEQSAGLLPDKNLSARDSLHKMTEGPACSGCHVHINGVGFGMEDLSPIGKPREIDDHSKPVNASSKFITTSSKEMAYEGIGGLNELLGRSERGQQCLTTQIFRYTYGRFETKEDQCTIAKARIQAGKSGTRLTDLLVNLYSSSLYLNRR